MAMTQNWHRRGLAGPLFTICLMAVMGLAALWLARPVSARNAPPIPTQAPTVTDDAREEIRDATAALQRVTAVKPIPQAVIDKALGVAVFGNLVKAAFIVGGTGGDGVFVRKMGEKWGAPAFVNLAGASVGAQIGGSKTDAVLLFMDQASLDALAAGRFEFGTAINAVAGPASATAETLSTSTVNKVYVYTVQEGLFAGASANGTTIRFDNEENQAVYGAATPQDFMAGKVETPKGLEGFAMAIKGRTGSN
jgi:lipid-binding SYLF domain-containing protein